VGHEPRRRDFKTGKELFKKPAEAKNKILAKGVTILNDGAGYLYGAYYKLNADINKDKPLGFALWKIKEDGNIIDEKYTSLENDFSEYLNITNRGKVQGIGYIYFQNIVQTSGGDLYILGEGYDKVLNVATIMSVTFLGFSIGGKGFMKKVSTDMLLIKLDSTCKIKDVTIYDKKNSDVFCYNNTQTNKQSNSFSFWYFSNKENVVNSINVNNDKVTTDKIRINLKTSSSMILPASNGQILLIEYFRSAKKMEVNFKTALN
jgi:hypothetical protein